MIDLTNKELFEDITYIVILGENFDLHNDFKCIGVKYSENERRCSFFFKKVSEEEKPVMLLLFEDAIISKCELNFQEGFTSTTLNLFYRGRFELDGKLFEKTESNEKYFYIEFETGGKFEFLATKVTFSCLDDLSEVYMF